MGDEIQAKDEQITYAIEFEETPEQFSDSRTINDGEKETLEFTASADLFNSKSGFGLLTITISYAETSGELADPCDTVSANLVVTGVPADWNHDNNVLSGVSSDCETINLTLYIYPEYDGEPKELQEWMRPTGAMYGPIARTGKASLNWTSKSSSMNPSPRESQLSPTRMRR